MADFYMVFVKRDDGIEMNCNTTGAPCPFTCTCGFTYFSTVFAHNPSGSSPWGAVANYTTSTIGRLHAHTRSRPHKCTRMQANAHAQRVKGTNTHTQPLSP